MTQPQINRSEMFDTVEAYLTANVTIWNKKPVIQTFLSQLSDFIAAIEGHQKDQNAAKVFINKHKKAQKKLVAIKADILNGSLAAYSAKVKDAELQSKAAKSSSALYKLRNDDFVTVINETIKLLEANLNNMVDYGVAEPQITDLKDSYDAFVALNGQPRQYRIASKVATQSLKELFTETNLLLTKMLDKVMKGFKESDPEFYKGYLAARVVVDK